MVDRFTTQQGYTAHEPSQPARVLLAEDEPQVRAVAARWLNAAGFEVVQAINGAVALTLLEAGPHAFDVLVTDVIMPELNGPELARAARKLNPHLGLVFMSGYPAPLHGAAVNEFAGAAFLSKPFTLEALTDAVRERFARASAGPRRKQTSSSPSL